MDRPNLNRTGVRLSEWERRELEWERETARMVAEGHRKFWHRRTGVIPGFTKVTPALTQATA
jgi:hypothetical protein